MTNDDEWVEGLKCPTFDDVIICERPLSALKMLDIM